ncbi:MAG: VOC family protein [Herpetosiphon sp.]|nr:VOC family protein [Herpetosiphon sp.]
MHTWLDHLVVVAQTLEIGKDYIRQLLGVEMQAGGIHERMATHNCLLRLGDSCYLEVLAPLPDGVPTMPRWFVLDQLGDAPPHLATWVARTDDIHAAVQAYPTAGTVQPMSRNQFHWLITLAEPHTMPADGILPALIQWQTPNHPPHHLPDAGCRLLKLDLFHAEADMIHAQLQALHLTADVHVHTIDPRRNPHLIATINTPTGIKQLTSQM